MNKMRIFTMAELLTSWLTLTGSLYKGDLDDTVVEGAEEGEGGQEEDCGVEGVEAGQSGGEGQGGEGHPQPQGEQQQAQQQEHHTPGDREVEQIHPQWLRMSLTQIKLSQRHMEARTSHRCVMVISYQSSPCPGELRPYTGVLPTVGTPGSKSSQLIE